LVKFFELVVVGEDDAPKRCAIEDAVRRENLIAPTANDFLECWRSYFDHPTCEHVGVDDCGATLGEQLGDCRLAAPDISS
jgi:hypothetical protein